LLKSDTLISLPTDNAVSLGLLIEFELIIRNVGF